MGKKAVTMVVNSIFSEVPMKAIPSCLPNHRVGWKKYYLEPIPTQEIALNPKLKQKPRLGNR